MTTDKILTDDEIQDRFEETDALAREIADAAAISLIESVTVEETVDGEEWISLDGQICGFAITDELELEIKYVEARNLLRHHPTRPNLVQIVEK